jgi:hypothetical protein
MCEYLEAIDVQGNEMDEDSSEDSLDVLEQLRLVEWRLEQTFHTISELRRIVKIFILSDAL